MQGITNPLPDYIIEKVLDTRIWLLIFLINVGGSIFGFYYYRFQLADYSPFLWIFIADSPISTLAISLSLYSRQKGLQSKLLNTYAYIGNLKYGLWTLLVLLFYSSTFLSVVSESMYFFLLISHIGMFLQSFLVYDYLKPGRTALLIFCFFLVNDALDYTLDIHSSLRGAETGSPSAAFVFALISSLLAASLYWFGRNSQNSKMFDLIDSRND